MTIRNYKWRGFTYQIADEDLKNYPGAELIEVKAKEAPKNKKRTSAKNKSAETEK